MKNLNHGPPQGYNQIGPKPVLIIAGVLVVVHHNCGLVPPDKPPVFEGKADMLDCPLCNLLSGGSFGLESERMGAEDRKVDSETGNA